MAKTPWVDQDECISCGLASTTFRGVPHGGQRESRIYDPGGASEDVIQSEAIDMCPVECIHWKE
jgi:ferredoxin